MTPDRIRELMALAEIQRDPAAECEMNRRLTPAVVRELCEAWLALRELVECETLLFGADTNVPSKRWCERMGQSSPTDRRRGMSGEQEFAVVMAFEAFRICIGQPTKKHSPREVMRWMNCMLKTGKPLARKANA